jgi:hypothetical protein
VQATKIKNRKRISQLRAEENQDTKRKRTEMDREKKAQQRKRDSLQCRQDKYQQRKSFRASRDKACIYLLAIMHIFLI